jgi:hypothetical protein
MLVIRSKENSLYTIRRQQGWLKTNTVMEEEPHLLPITTSQKMTLDRNTLYWVDQSKLYCANIINPTDIRSYPYHK